MLGLLASEEIPNWRVDRETFYCHAWLYLVYIYVLFVHNMESVRRILQAWLEKGNCLEKLAMLISLMKKMATD